MRDPAYATDDATPFTVHTRWIETEFNNSIPAYSGTEAGEDPAERTSMVALATSSWGFIR